MLKALLLKLAPILAGKIVSKFGPKIAAWISAMIGVGIGDGFAWLVAHIPVVAAHVDPKQVMIWVTMTLVAPLINHIGNLGVTLANGKGPEASEAADVADKLAEEVASDLLKEPGDPIVKAEPVDPAVKPQ